MFKFLTYNIHKGFNRYNRSFILHKIREQLEAVTVDVVFLQEIHGQQLDHQAKVTGWPEEAQFEFLADQLLPHYAYGKNAIYDKGHHGNAILSKHGFERWDNVNVSRFSWSSRSFLHGVIRRSEHGPPLHLICVHLEFVGFERNRQLKILSQYINEVIPDNEAVIVAGDFNDWSGRTGLRFEMQSGMREAFRQSLGGHAKTFPSHRPFLGLDRIYYRGVELIKCDCLSGHPWQKMSDHLPLYAEFSL